LIEILLDHRCAFGEHEDPLPPSRYGAWLLQCRNVQNRKSSSNPYLFCFSEDSSYDERAAAGSWSQNDIVTSSPPLV